MLRESVLLPTINNLSPLGVAIASFIVTSATTHLTSDRYTAILDGTASQVRTTFREVILALRVEIQLSFSFNYSLLFSRRDIRATKISFCFFNIRWNESSYIRLLRR